MAHPDHYEVIGRLVGARLRGPADRRAVSGGAAEPHPDAETWAAYVDGGLGADEVTRLETHLAECPACRRLLAVLVPEVSSSSTAPAVRDAETPAAGRGVVLPFPRRQVFVWMAAAAGLLMAVTLWSVSRLGTLPSTGVAMSTAPAAPEPPAAVSSGPSPAESAKRMSVPSSRLDDGKAIDRTARQEQDTRTRDARSVAAADRVQAEMGARSVVPEAGAGAGPALGAVGGRVAEPARPAEEKPAIQAAAPPVNARDIQLQTNTAAAGARPRGPLATQQANQQARQQPSQEAGNLRQNAPATAASATAAPLPATPVAVVAGAAVPAPAAAPAPPPAQADAAVARERRANEQLAEAVTVTSGANREGQARSKDELAKSSVLGYAGSASALPSFAEPGGRLRWRITEGRRLESSSDGGTTWTSRYYVARGDQLRAGTAPAIDSAWAVGERGRVLRLTVPGGWAEVPRPTTAALIAVSATGAQSARVTAADGSVFETTDGGATWTPAAPGAGPR